MSLDWYCLRTVTKREFTVEKQLQELGQGEVYCPKEYIDMRTRRKPDLIEIAAFLPSYLFFKHNAGLDGDSFDRVQKIKSVVEIIRSKNMEGYRYPTKVSDILINEIKSKESAGIIDSRQLYGEGDRVRLKTGKFDEYFAGEIVALKNKLFVILLDNGSRLTVSDANMIPDVI